MSGNNDIVDSIKGKSTLERAKFGPGMLLRHDDLEQLTTYPRELSRLLFRSLFGCGVVCGLVVQPPEDKCDKIWVRVSSGLALDCAGNPIHVPKDSEPLSFDAKCPDKPLWVILCGTITACSPRTSACASDDEESSPAPSREKDGYEIRIVSKLPECICACLREPVTDPATNPAANPATGQPIEPAKERAPRCPCVGPEHPCYADHYDGKCGCEGGKDCECCCDCVVLARLNKSEQGAWEVTHKVRRFVRPVLMRDPQVEKEKEAEKQVQKKDAEIEEQKRQQQQLAAQIEEQKRQQQRLAAQIEEQKRVQQQLAARSSKSRSSK